MLIGMRRACVVYVIQDPYTNSSCVILKYTNYLNIDVKQMLLHIQPSIHSDNYISMKMKSHVHSIKVWR